MDPVYGFAAVNVESQLRSSTSLLNWTRRLLAIRQAQKVFGRGKLEFLYPGNRKILAFLRTYEDRTILCVFNLSRSAQAVELDLTPYRTRTPVELMGRSAFPPIGDLSYLLTLPSYGFFWFVIAAAEELPAWHGTIPEPVPELVTLVAREGWRDIVKNPALALLEKDSLPNFIARQRWFGGKDARISSAKIAHSIELKSEAGSYLLTEVDVKLANGGAQAYFLPIAVSNDAESSSGGGGPVSFMIAQVRRGAKLSGLYDAAMLRDFPLALLRCMVRGEVPEGSEGHFRAIATDELKALEIPPDGEVRRLSAEQSNTSILVADLVMLKLLRRIVEGIHPEIELGLFLKQAGYQHVPPLLGAIEHVNAGKPTAVVIAQGFVRNQGDGWSNAVDYLQRWFEEYEIRSKAPPATGTEPPAVGSPPHEFYFDLIATLGRRIGELHQVLAQKTGNPAFDPEPIAEKDLKAWRFAAYQIAQDALAALRRAQPNLTGDVKSAADSLLKRKKECIDLLQSLTERPLRTCKTRIHGDLHLGQVLLTQKDWVVIDFEGEPTRPLAMRRSKHTPLRDVAGILRSFDYAARSALRRAATSIGPNAQTLTDQALSWRDRAIATFLQAYEGTVRNVASFPQEDAERRRWLDFFMLEKACYELRYEAANRPDWLEIPIRGITTILDFYAHASARVQ
jgi:maltose alpha-D-glucosyltransferase/alpha-amylase